MPSEEDIVLARIRTTGIREERLKVCIILLLLLSLFLLLMLLLLLLLIRLTIKYFNFLMLVDKETKEENGLIVLMVCFTYQGVIVVVVDDDVVVVGVHGVMFVTAISEFDQKLFESDSVNRMVESLDLFEQIVNENAFVNAAMILFLNKSDLYEEKVCCYYKDLYHSYCKLLLLILLLLLLLYRLNMLTLKMFRILKTTMVLQMTKKKD